MLRRTGASLAAFVLVAAIVPGLALAKGSKHSGKGHKGPHLCSGTATAPGTLFGTYAHGVVVKGYCEATAETQINGQLKLRSGSALFAAFGSLNPTAPVFTVRGSVVVGRGAALLLGCNHTESPCMNDPDQNNATFDGPAKVTGSITASKPLGVLVHNATVGGNYTEVGGGGGLGCDPATTGPFSLFQSPVYSTVEDSSVHGNVEFKDIQTCWIGVARVHTHGNLLVIHNKTGDPDAIEIISNNVHKNLVCHRNSHPSGMPAGTEPVWDSTEATETGAIYPRTPEPNTVQGKRLGQCKLASPATAGGPLGPGPF
jgi:hypothetical protein